MKLVVIKKFHGLVENKDFEPGDTISVHDVKRVNAMVKRGLCEIVAEEPAPTNNVEEKVSVAGGEFEFSAVKKALAAIGVPVSKKAGLVGVVEALEKLTEEQTAALSEALKAKEEGRKEVILFNLSGHGLIDMAAYDRYIAGDLVNGEVTDEEITRNLKDVEDFRI